MSDTNVVNIAGVDVDISELIEAQERDGEMIVDVVIIARAVDYTGERAADSVIAAVSKNTAGVVQSGMVNDLKVLMDRATIEANFGCGCPEEDD